MIASHSISAPAVIFKRGMVAPVQWPYVLVGHSLGGVNMQLYASLCPDEVAEMVSVDSATEDETSTTLTVSAQRSPVWLKILAPIGVTRLPYTLGEKQTSEPRSVPTLRMSTHVQMRRLRLRRVSNSNPPLPRRWGTDR